jgi:hypothetical protein
MKLSVHDFTFTGLLAMAFTFVLAACGGPGTATPGGGLMYQVPDPPTLRYVTGDTTNIDVDAGAMGSMRMRSTNVATVRFAFERTAAGLQVTATFEELDARMTQPMGGAQTASAEDVEGPLVFTMTKEGDAQVVTMPELSGAGGSLANPHVFAYEFFPRLPGGVVNPGEMWTDTIDYDADLPDGSVSSTSVLTYTLRGDTVVDGRDLLWVTYEGDADVVGQAVTQGMDVTQTFSGQVEGIFFWDPIQAMMVWGESSHDMDGTVDVPAAGTPPMPMTARGTSHIRLAGS